MFVTREIIGKLLIIIITCYCEYPLDRALGNWLYLNISMDHNVISLWLFATDSIRCVTDQWCKHDFRTGEGSIKKKYNVFVDV